MGFKEKNLNPDIDDMNRRGNSIGSPLRIVIRIGLAVSILVLFCFSCSQKYDIPVSAKNASVEGSLKIIFRTQLEYQQKFGRYGSLVNLVKEKLFDPALASGIKSTHSYSLETSADAQEYKCFASPLTDKQLNSYILFSSGIIRGGKKNLEKATPDDPVLFDLKKSPDE
jgi:hypothetical protein